MGRKKPGPKTERRPRLCNWPGGCHREAHHGDEDGTRCRMHEVRLPLQTEALERLAGAAKDLLWEMDGRKRRNLRRPNRTSRPVAQLRANLRFAEAALDGYDLR